MFFPIVTYIQVERIPEQEKMQDRDLILSLGNLLDVWIIVVCLLLVDLMWVQVVPPSYQ